MFSKIDHSNLRNCSDLIHRLSGNESRGAAWGQSLPLVVPLSDLCGSSANQGPQIEVFYN